MMSCNHGKVNIFSIPPEIRCVYCNELYVLAPESLTKEISNLKNKLEAADAKNSLLELKLEHSHNAFDILKNSKCSGCEKRDEQIRTLREANQIAIGFITALRDEQPTEVMRQACGAGITMRKIEALMKGA